MKVAAGSGDQVGVVPLDIDALYTEHAAFLTRVLVRLVGDGPHVDDMLQETFLVAHRRRDSFDGRAAVRTWLYAIASRLAMRHRRGVGRWLRALGAYADEPAPPPGADPSHELDRARATAIVREVLAKLPFKQREVFVLYELEEIEGAEIAGMLGIPINTVWTRLHHGRKRFQELVKKRSEAIR